MVTVSKIKKCYKCGALLQTSEPNEIGYISKQIVEKYPNGLLVCNDCYKKAKEEKTTDVVIDPEYYNIVDEIVSKRPLIVYVVDLFSFEGSFIDDINIQLKDCDVLAIGNKRDLLPANANDQELIKYVEERLKLSNLNVVDVVLTSSTKKYNIDIMTKKIAQYSQNRDVYFVGASVSGKSLLIQEFLKEFTNNTNKPIITHTFKGTSLRGFKIPLDKKTYIYETPGFPINNSMLSILDLLEGRKLIPEHALSPKLFKINQGHSIILGGLALIELLVGIEQQVEVYVNTEIDVKVSRNGESSFADAIKHKILRPNSKSLNSFADFDVYDFKILEDEERDIGILGLGWIHFKGNKQTFRAFIPKGVYVYTSKSKVKYVKQQSKKEVKTIS